MKKYLSLLALLSVTPLMASVSQHELLEQNQTSLKLSQIQLDKSYTFQSVVTKDGKSVFIKGEVISTPQGKVKLTLVDAIVGQNTLGGGELNFTFSAEKARTAIARQLERFGAVELAMFALKP